MDIYRVKADFPNDIQNQRCPVDGNEGHPFAEGDLVVQCPQCKSWHHVDCWRFLGKCAVLNCTGAGIPSTHIIEVPTKEAARSSRPPGTLLADDGFDDFDAQISILDESTINLDPGSEDLDFTVTSESPTVVISKFDIQVQVFANSTGIGKLLDPVVKAIVRDRRYYFIGLLVAALALFFLFIFIGVLLFSSMGR